MDSKGSKRSVNGLPMIHAKVTTKGVTKSAIWILEPTAIIRDEFNLCLTETLRAAACSATLPATGKRMRPTNPLLICPVEVRPSMVNEKLSSDANKHSDHNEKRNSHRNAHLGICRPIHRGRGAGSMTCCRVRSVQQAGEIAAILVSLLLPGFWMAVLVWILVREKLEAKVAQIDEKQDNRNTVANHKDVVAFLRVC